MADVITTKDEDGGIKMFRTNFMDFTFCALVRSQEEIVSTGCYQKVRKVRRPGDEVFRMTKKAFLCCEEHDIKYLRCDSRLKVDFVNNTIWRADEGHHIYDYNGYIGIGDLDDLADPSIVIMLENGDILDIFSGCSPDNVIDKVDVDDNETVRSIGNFNVSDYVRYFRDLRSDYFGQIVKNLPDHESRWDAYRTYIVYGESPENFHQNYIGHYDSDQEAIDDLRERGNDADLKLIGDTIARYDGYYFWNID